MANNIYPLKCTLYLTYRSVHDMDRPVAKGLKFNGCAIVQGTVNKNPVAPTKSTLSVSLKDK